MISQPGMSVSPILGVGLGKLFTPMRLCYQAVYFVWRVNRPSTRAGGCYHVVSQSKPVSVCLSEGHRNGDEHRPPPWVHVIWE